uniref:Uncharacterized protein n=1 Tax=Arundo donax TaxID=35708 RepID=A0A0A9TYS9_ARUDO
MPFNLLPFQTDCRSTVAKCQNHNQL